MKIESYIITCSVISSVQDFYTLVSVEIGIFSQRFKDFYL